ncbi:MAG: DUF1385 domain-containing protein [Lachnospiraceae bacterium]|nr:DUF1385 domain-containing protein [Lachnospiraceae bacterium]MDE7058565.1 DUF1385 domain-containing protein [Lachnospiraceae bacterium]
MRPSGIGGQAVLEGIMMKNKTQYSVAVRKPDGEIEVHTSVHEGIAKDHAWAKIPFVRGVVNFIDSLVLGMETLTYSASFYEEEEEEKPGRFETLLLKLFGEKAEKVVMGCTVAFSVVMAVAIFMILPYFISGFFRDYIVSNTLLAIIEGGIRLGLFVLYVVLISSMKDIRRVYMYHGAEHKCINCIERGRELNVKNVRNSSRYHSRCGTSFLFIVMIISIVFFIFIRVEAPALRVLYRILLIPVIAGVSYEFIRLAGRSENPLVSFLSLPGKGMQKLTTKEPDDDMIEVAIAAVEAVFDWKEFQKKEWAGQEGEA